MFISFEGPDGSGKTTQLAPLADFLTQLGYQVLITREPGGTAIGDQIRQVLADLQNTGIHPRSETLLFLAARAQLVEQIIDRKIRHLRADIAGLDLVYVEQRVQHARHAAHRLGQPRLIRHEAALPPLGQQPRLLLGDGLVGGANRLAPFASAAPARGRTGRRPGRRRSVSPAGR